jgi:type II restriction/modification system DNA methylase subunit YeeA
MPINRTVGTHSFTPNSRARVKPNLSITDFVARWQGSTLSERSASHQHFIDLCELLEQPRPAHVDQDGTTYTFEKGVTKTTGEGGFADVWMRGYFAWEYKGKHKDLKEAYQQLLQYREDLENPPLLVVCDFENIEVHTNFTNTPKQVYRFTLADLLDNSPSERCPLAPLDVLRSIFSDPSRLKPGLTTAQVTEEAAEQFARLAISLRKRGVPSERAAHFLMRLLFCLFSEDIGLLPDGLFTRLIQANCHRPKEFTKRLKQLFTAMANEGGAFGEHDIPYFDGGLFLDDEAYELSADDLKILARATKLNWAGIEPAIFGILFERSLDPDKRSQLGAHYTSQKDIELIVEPVLMAPLRKRWFEIRQQATNIINNARGQQKAGQVRSRRAISEILKNFSAELAQIRVLDPACGSGNFLYMALKELLDLEKEVSVFAASNGLSGLLPLTNPEQLYGIETNIYAHELASVVVWIGFIQWQHENGFISGSHPVLRPLQNIRRMDAVLAYDKDGNPIEPEWPSADVVIGNPPFLGDKKMREGLGDKYVDDLRSLYDGRVPGGADFVTFWFERAREQIQKEHTGRVGLLATNSITMIANRKVLERIKETGDVFMAWSDRPWILDGAAVRVSMIGFDNGSQREKFLDGHQVLNINADLTTGLDLTGAVSLRENAGLCFLGMMKGGPFEIDDPTAHKMLSAPVNPNGRPNADVIKRRLGGQDVVGRPRRGWIIDFVQMNKNEAALYELPFEYVRQHVKPVRDKTRDALMRKNWWLHGRSRPALRKALVGLKHCIVTPEVSKHRIFVWMDTETVPDHKLHVIASGEDCIWGILQSRAHEAWTLAQCSWIGVGNDPSYSSSRTFETFPFPWPPTKQPPNDSTTKKIAEAVRELVERRDAWLNPPGATTAELASRTLTRLYNESPAWLHDAHGKLDAAVFAAYGWPKNLSNNDLLMRLLQLNQIRAEEDKSATKAVELPFDAATVPKKTPASVPRHREGSRGKSKRSVL